VKGSLIDLDDKYLGWWREAAREIEERFLHFAALRSE
jgi:hypothetical protein